MTNSLKPQLFRFVRELRENNRRDWFLANKERYEDDVRDASLQFISDFAPHLDSVSRHFNAIPKSVGGSLFRIYRDVRFGRDKTPYKTHVGIHFRHKMHKDAHAPGFYLHLEPKGSFMGCGIWRPDAPALKNIRAAIASDRSRWLRIKRSSDIPESLELGGDSLVRAPKGFDPDHVSIEDLKRKSFIAVRQLTQKQVTSSDFVGDFAGMCAGGAPLVRFLCKALDVPF